MRPTAVRAVDLCKEYGRGGTRVVALDRVCLDIPVGAFTAIMGPSGSGKSTLLHNLAGLDRPTSGAVLHDETDLTGLSDDQLTVFRRRELGFVFQSFNLVPTLSARENIALPLTIAGRKPDRELFESLVHTCGLAERLDHRPTELSGGQQQRVACARALINEPRVVFADEPTGNLDSQSSTQILALLRRSVDQFGRTVVMVTHDPVAAAQADRVVFLRDGVVASEMSAPTPERIIEQMLRLSPRSATTSVAG